MLGKAPLTWVPAEMMLEFRLPTSLARARGSGQPRPPARRAACPPSPPGSAGSGPRAREQGRPAIVRRLGEKQASLPWPCLFPRPRGGGGHGAGCACSARRPRAIVQAPRQVASPAFPLAGRLGVQLGTDSDLEQNRRLLWPLAMSPTATRAALLGIDRPSASGRAV